MEKDETPDPLRVGFFGADTVVLRAYDIAHLVEQFRLPGFHVLYPDWEMCLLPAVAGDRNIVFKIHTMSILMPAIYTKTYCLISQEDME